MKEGREGGEGRKPLPALLLAPFFSRSLTLVPRSLLLNRTETLATQAMCRLTQFHPSYDALLTLFLTISIHCQEIRLWELIKWSPKRKHFDHWFIKFSHSFFREKYGDQFGEFVCGYWDKGLGRCRLSKVDPNRASIPTQWILYFESRHALGLRLSHIKIKLLTITSVF